MELLERLEGSQVPPAGCHHSLTFHSFMTAENGLQRQLAVNVWTETGYRPIFLEDGDLENKSGHELASEILALCKE